ncbi:MAG: hypothetical protein WC229_03435 [Candidatus Paceibacterota bacterium]|jgi:hypothetical protein
MQKNKGLIKMVVVVVIALIVLGYFGFNIKDIIESDSVQTNLQYVWGFIKTFWNNYLAAPVIFVWDKFVVGVLWRLIQEGLAAMNLG